MKKVFNYIVAGVLGCALLTGCSADALDIIQKTDEMNSPLFDSTQLKPTKVELLKESK